MAGDARSIQLKRAFFPSALIPDHVANGFKRRHPTMPKIFIGVSTYLSFTLIAIGCGDRCRNFKSAALARVQTVYLEAFYRRRRGQKLDERPSGVGFLRFTMDSA